MSQFQSEYQPQPPRPPVMSPPQFAGDIPAQPSSWPTVIGIILIIVASIGMLSNVCGGVASAFLPMIMSQAGDAAKNSPTAQVQIDVATKYLWFHMTNAAVLFLLGILLLAAGIGVLKRKASSVKLTRLWAVLRILWTLPAGYVGYIITVESLKAMEQAAADSGQPMPGAFATLIDAMGVVGVIITILFACFIPVFMLIWFSVRKIKAETATWA